MSILGIAKASSKHPWRTLGLWVVALLVMGTLSSKLLAGVLTQDIAFTNHPQSVAAQKIIDDKFTRGTKAKSTEFYIVQSKTLTVDSAAFKAKVQDVAKQASAVGDDILAGPVASYYDLVNRDPAAAAGLVSADKHTVLVPVPVKSDDTAKIDKLRAIATNSNGEAVTVQIAGAGTLGADFSKIAEQDLKKGESVGIGIALIILIVVFGSILAAVVPIVMAIFAIGVAMGLVALVGQVFDFNLFVTNMITMIGLAVGIDYSLFIVSRYREERKKGKVKLDAIAASAATANRAVFFSGMTVVLALSGMLIIPVTIFRSLAGGAITVTVAALAASLTLLPAVIALLGDKINWPRLSKRAHMDSHHDPRGGFWDKVTGSVMSHAWVYLIASVLVLGALGSFYFQLHRGTSQSVTNLSADFPSKQAFLTLTKEFPGGLTQPVPIVLTGDVKSAQAQAGIKRLQTAIGQNGAFAKETTVTPSADGTAIKVEAFFAGDPTADSAFAAIRNLRAAVAASLNGVPSVQGLVGGDTAFFTDFLTVANNYQWVVLAMVLTLSFILLTVVFRSIVLPVSAIIMNLLSVGAAYGALVLVFQKGMGISFFNKLGFKFQHVAAIEAWLPLFLFSVLFGLSMDYHVFLLSRIREAYDKTKDNTKAVAWGLRTTAGIITGAALIMVAVFTGFAAGRLGPLQQMGFGLAIAILIDATIVRTLLVPATMRILGERNWYLPKWLEWLPHINVENANLKKAKKA